jgi:hypothetical protein
LVSCADPRYLTTLRRRVETSSSMRWSRTITQSETYSSIPWRVSALSPRSPVTMAVTARSSSQRNSRPSSARTIAWPRNAPYSNSIVSSTTRFAPMRSMVSSRRRNSGSRSNSPVSITSEGSTRKACTTSSPSRWSPSRSNPSEATLALTLSADSSKVTSTPGSPYSCAPATRNSSPSSVLPDPAPPVTSVDRPWGRPPRVISSSPRIPVGAFGSVGPPATSTRAEIRSVPPRSDAMPLP